MKLLLAAFLVAVTATPAHAAVTQDQFDRIQPGWSRWHVQQVFGDEGKRVAMFATAHRRHLFKAYAAADGQVVRIEYVGPLCQCGPFVAPYHVWRKSMGGAS